MCVLDVPVAAENLIVSSLRSVPVDIALLHHVTVLKNELSGGARFTTFGPWSFENQTKIL